MRRTFTVIFVCASSLARADAPADATALFEQGIKDMQAGSTEQACKELAASLAKYPDSGTKGALAECYTTLGKVVSAWNLWKDLADTAPAPDLKADAAANAAALQPRLPHFVIKLTAETPGLVVTANGAAVADPTLAVPLPADPGSLVIIARAPDHKSWTRTFQAVEKTTTTVEIPELAELAKPVAPKPEPAAHAEPTTVVLREDNAATRHSRHVIGGSFAILGAVAAGAGAYFGSQAFSKWDQVKAACGGSIEMCPSAALPQATDLTGKARTDALVSTVLFATGGAAIVTGAIVWLSAPSDERRTAQTVQLAPSLDARSFGLTLSGRFR